MSDKSTAAMRHGVENAACVIAVITGPCQNPDSPDDLPASNAYFGRPYCVAELRWARDAGVMIQPVIRAVDKCRIAELMSLAPDDLQFISDIDFITLDRSDNDFWAVGIKKVMRAAGVTARVTSPSIPAGSGNPYGAMHVPHGQQPYAGMPQASMSPPPMGTPYCGASAAYQPTAPTFTPTGTTAGQLPPYVHATQHPHHGPAGFGGGGAGSHFDRVQHGMLHNRMAREREARSAGRHAHTGSSFGQRSHVSSVHNHGSNHNFGGVHNTGGIHNHGHR